MIIDKDKWFLDFCEKGQMWHHDVERVPENPEWVNIGYGRKAVLNHFCDMVDLMVHEFGMKFTPDQIIRLAECTPGLTVHNPTPVPEDSFDEEVHMAPIWAREHLEKLIEWKEEED
jgi:hypothetical protein